LDLVHRIQEGLVKDEEGRDKKLNPTTEQVQLRDWAV
jgi:hypothetical protein